MDTYPLLGRPRLLSSLKPFIRTPSNPSSCRPLLYPTFVLQWGLLLEVRSIKVNHGNDGSERPGDPPESREGVEMGRDERYPTPLPSGDFESEGIVGSKTDLNRDHPPPFHLFFLFFRSRKEGHNQVRV